MASKAYQTLTIIFALIGVFSIGFFCGRGSIGGATSTSARSGEASALNAPPTTVPTTMTTIVPPKISTVAIVTAPPAAQPTTHRYRLATTGERSNANGVLSSLVGVVRTVTSGTSTDRNMTVFVGNDDVYGEEKFDCDHIALALQRQRGYWGEFSITLIRDGEPIAKVERDSSSQEPILLRD